MSGRSGSREDEGKQITAAGHTARLVRSSRKSLTLQICEDGSLVVRAPLRMSEERICAFLQEKDGWIRSHQEKLVRQREQRRREVAPLSPEQREACVEQALVRFAQRAAYYAPLVGVIFGRITIRDQKTRWGSCSRAGNLNFNFRLVMAPPEILDYVVVHELCHRKQMNHSPFFWAEVARVLPDYEQRRRWLRENGWRLMG